MGDKAAVVVTVVGKVSEHMPAAAAVVEEDKGTGVEVEDAMEFVAIAGRDSEAADMQVRIEAVEAVHWHAPSVVLVGPHLQQLGHQGRDTR